MKYIAFLLTLQFFSVAMGQTGHIKNLEWLVNGKKVAANEDREIFYDPPANLEVASTAELDNPTADHVDFNVTWKITDGTVTNKSEWDPTLDPYSEDSKSSYALARNARVTFHASVTISYRMGTQWVVEEAVGVKFIPKGKKDFSELPIPTFY